jgi:hypothetical protein
MTLTLRKTGATSIWLMLICCGPIIPMPARMAASWK